MKKALEGTDTENIKQATEKLTKEFYSISEKLYSQAASAQNQAAGTAEGTTDNANTEANSDGNVYDADYKVEDENK